MSLVFRLKTKEEVEEEVRKLRAEPGHQQVSDICGFGDDGLVDLTKTQPTREEPAAPPADLTKTEQRQVDERVSTKVTLNRIFGESLDSDELPENEVARAMLLQQKKAELEKFLGVAGARKAMRRLYGFVGDGEPIRVTADGVRQLRESAALGKLPGRTRDLFSEALLKIIDRHADDEDDSTQRVVQFVRGYAENNEAAMRQVVRRIVAA